MNTLSSNEELAKAFDQLAIQFKREHYRSRAYRNAAEAIRNHCEIIESGAQAQRDIKGIGKSIGAKIDEMIATGKLSIIQDRPKEEIEKENVAKIFEGIYGVGPVTAGKWYNQGYRTLEDLKLIYSTFTDAQKLGYYYYYHLKQRIPRVEMDQIKAVIDGISRKLGITYEICGSYRRGEATSGDIDCLIKGGPDVNLAVMVTELVNGGYIVGHLAIGDSKYMGIMKLDKNSNARRIDLMVVPPESWPYATLYFTGSKGLNVIMRSKALDLGLSMNEYGMVDHRDNSFPARTEQDIFRYLGMGYLEPTQRSIGRK